MLLRRERDRRGGRIERASEARGSCRLRACRGAALATPLAGGLELPSALGTEYLAKLSNMLLKSGLLHVMCNNGYSGNLPSMLPRSSLLHVLGNIEERYNILVREGLRSLQRRLPPGWQVREPDTRSVSVIDAMVALVAPDRKLVRIAVVAKRQLDPKHVPVVAEAFRRAGVSPPFLVISRYLSPSVRERLRERTINFLDLTGNTYLAVGEPGLFIETHGANEDPEREERSARSLRGPKAGRIVRMLVDSKSPPGVRELAASAGVDAGYASRVLAFLDGEALVTRVGHGRLQSVDWPRLLGRWARDAPLEARGAVATYLEPRGLLAFLARLGKSTETYAVTGSLAAARFAPSAPARLGAVWVRDAKEAAARLGLRPVDAGANVLLIEPSDEGVFRGTIQHEGIWYAAPSQVAADLLASPGRGPAEAEELIAWMQEHEDVWRR